MSSYVPEWVHYGDTFGYHLTEIFTRAICLFTVFGLPILFFVVWAIDEHIYSERELKAGEVKNLDNLTKAGAKFQDNCVDNGVDYAIYVWIVDQLKKDLDFMGYSPINVDAALMYIPLSIDEVFGGTSLHDRALRLFESQEDYFRKMLID